MSSRTMDRIATALIWAAAMLILAVLAWFVLFIVIRGASAVDLAFLTRAPESMRAGGGIGPQLWNSFYLLLLSMLITLPIGIGAGIYMAEYARPGLLTDALRLSTETLASLPSIVIGLFGLLLFVGTFGMGFSVLAGALALTVLNLPLMVRITEQAVRAVPRELREASLGLGTTHWYTIRKVLLPAAFPGLLTGGILTAGRVFGEAAALLYTAGLSGPRLDFTAWNPMDPRSPLNPMRPAASLAVHIWKTNAEGLVPDVQRVANGSAAVLVLAVLFFNLAARGLGSVIVRRMEGK